MNFKKIADTSFTNLIESQWKLRQQHDQNFPMAGKPLQNIYFILKPFFILKIFKCLP